MDEIVLTDRLVSQGFSRDEVGRMCRRGTLRRVRRGAYAAVPAGPPVDAPAAADLHRQLIVATVPQLRADAVVSHVSAAVLHDLPVWSSDLTTVHLTRPRVAGGGKRRSLVTLHGNALADADRTEIDGIPVTSLPRTVLDLARSVPFERAVAAGDRALAIGMAVEILTEMLDARPKWAGIGRARRVAGFVDGRAESAGESVSRVRCRDLGLPAPTLQLEVRDGSRFVARCDFGWEEQRTIGEFDGMVKYQKLVQPGETAADVVIREKQREDWLRSLGWQVVRWVWADLYRFGLVREQLEAAFARTQRLR